LQRIGLFGGTFNPIHRGHIHAADIVAKKFPLHKIILIPSALPPHKAPDNLAGAEDRLEMIRLAAADQVTLHVSDVEISRSGPSYTIDTVAYYQEHFSSQIKLYLIVGIDAFLEIETWKSYAELLKKIPFIVMSRPRAESPGGTLDVDLIQEYLTRTVSTKYIFSSTDACFEHPDKKPIFILDIKPLDISSTDIRFRIKHNRSVRSLVPEAVEAYIQTRGLYK
jgi:nicotinate-nucleotide adenylyltransferase